MEDKEKNSFPDGIRVAQQNLLPKCVHQRHIFQGWVIFSGLAANRPDGTTQIKAYFATDTHILSLWDGTSWFNVTLT